jgi:hypothetical protein
MDPKLLFAAVAVAYFALGNAVANPGKTLEEAGTLACVVDKWDETEPKEGYKRVDAAMRCIAVPDDPAAPKYTEDCVAKYEYMPDGSWKGSGTCTFNFKDGDKLFDTIEEGSHLEEYTYRITGGTGKYQGASGGGTYTYESLSDTLSGGRYKGKLQLR